jgi:hypothetical protein
MIKCFLPKSIVLHFLEVGAVFVIGFLYNYFITGILEPIIFSKYALFVLNLNLVISLVEGGIGSAIVRFRIHNQSVINYLIVLQLCIFSVVILFGVLIHLHTSYLNHYYWYGGAAVILSIISVNFYSSLLSKEEFSLLANFRVISYLLSSVLVALLVWLNVEDAIFFIFIIRPFFEILLFISSKGFSVNFEKPYNLKGILIESRLLASNGLLNSLSVSLFFSRVSNIEKGYFLSTWNRVDVFVGTAFKQFGGVASKIFFPKFVNGASTVDTNRMIVGYISAVFFVYNVTVLFRSTIINILGLRKFTGIENIYFLVLLFVLTDTLISLFNSFFKSEGNVYGVYLLTILRFLPFFIFINPLAESDSLIIVLSSSLLLSVTFFLLTYNKRDFSSILLLLTISANLYFGAFLYLFAFVYLIYFIFNYFNFYSFKRIID